ncbi:hypothetical protein EVAR_102877_1 [Eumeta japonica]|uniref:Uncharacterized protein n=1 Tax=Eumeta variegata TaxID=151549 RepID=A0A4C1UME7_EUMVA|nr:hypothetical protein EVAR_102877_1 [Eumeta japonica]
MSSGADRRGPLRVSQGCKSWKPRGRLSKRKSNLEMRLWRGYNTSSASNTVPVQKELPDTLKPMRISKLAVLELRSDGGSPVKTIGYGLEGAGLEPEFTDEFSDEFSMGVDGSVVRDIAFESRDTAFNPDLGRIGQLVLHSSKIKPIAWEYYKPLVGCSLHRQQRTVAAVNPHWARVKGY